MNIVLITGSAHKHGTTATLAENFIRGAKDAGHEIFRFDAAYHNIHPCIGCDTCNSTGEGCVFKDDMQQLNPHLVVADAVVFVSPIYYYNLNAQIKTAIDRFYANDGKIHGHKKTALITALADEVGTTKGVCTAFDAMAEYLEWEVCGKVIAHGCGDAASLEGTDFCQQAYELGNSI